MIKKVRVGLIVWGAILIVISFIFAGLGNTEGTFYILFAMLFLGGAIMLVFGILNAVKTTRYNNELMSGATLFYGVCPSCRTEIKCSIRDFRPHGKYPEGFLYCPVCKKPVSKNAFKEEVSNGL